jgi:antitoxin PrlF
MPAIFDIESTLTDRFQTTIPEPVRRALRLDKRDKIHYVILPDGNVQLTRVAENDDPVLGQFLQFLANDIAAHPAQLQAVDASLQERIRALVGDVEVDLGAPLAAEDE